MSAKQAMIPFEKYEALQQRFDVMQVDLMNAKYLLRDKSKDAEPKMPLLLYLIINLIGVAIFLCLLAILFAAVKMVLGA